MNDMAIKIESNLADNEQTKVVNNSIFKGNVILQLNYIKRQLKCMKRL